MLFEIGSTIIMSGITGMAYLKTNGSSSNDADKIQKIFLNAGWSGKNETIRLHKKRRIEGGAEYIYQLPLGFDRTKIENGKHILEDGLNIRHKFIDIDPRDLLKIKWNKTVLKQMKKILNTKKIRRKEIELEFDGMLKIRVYNESMKEQYDWDESYLKLGTWSVAIGNTRKATIYHDFDKYKHLIVAGSTGYGKSAVLKLIISSLILQHPQNVKLHLIDLKGGSAFRRFKDLEQTNHFTRDPEEAKEILKKIKLSMEKTFAEVVNDGFEDVIEAKIKERHFIIIDEAADIADDSSCMEIVTDIARRGRSAGYYLIYSTQYPSSQSIPQQTKRNIPSRLCFVLDDATASNTALGQTGAESLPLIPGRGIYKNVKSQIIQSPYISNKQIEKVISPYITRTPRKEGVRIEKSAEDGGNPFKLEEM